MRFGEAEPSPAIVRQRLLTGALRIFSAEALIIPSGILIAVLLTRRLEPEGYGLFGVATAMVVWVEWGVASLFSRQTIKLVSEVEDWSPVGAAAVRQTMYGSIVAASALCLGAQPLASALHAPQLTPLLWLYALDIPLFCLSRVHRNILIGLDESGERALIAASRLIARPILIWVFIETGMGVYGAVLGTVCASLCELLLCRLYVRPAFFGASLYPAKVLWHSAATLFFTALSFRLFNRLDLLILNVFSQTTAPAGIYAAAQSIALLPNLLGLSCAPLLMATMSRLRRAGDIQTSREVATLAWRGVFLLLPCVSLIAAYSRELTGLLYGPQYTGAASPMAMLIYAATFQLLISIATSILMATGQPRWSLALTGALLSVALGGHLLFIPRYGLMGAAAVTAVSALAGGAASMLVIFRVAKILPPVGTMVRTSLVAIFIYVLATFMSSRHLPLPLNVFLSVSLIPLTLLWLGEFKHDLYTTHTKKWMSPARAKEYSPWPVPVELSAPVRQPRQGRQSVAPGASQGNPGPHP